MSPVPEDKTRTLLVGLNKIVPAVASTSIEPELLVLMSAPALNVTLFAASTLMLPLPLVTSIPVAAVTSLPEPLALSKILPLSFAVTAAFKTRLPAASRVIFPFPAVVVTACTTVISPTVVEIAEVPPVAETPTAGESAAGP